MSDSLKFVMELVDRASGPATAIGKSLDKVKGTLKKLDLEKITGKLRGGLESVGKGALSVGASIGSALAKGAAIGAAAFLALGATAGAFALKQIAEQESNDLALRTVIRDTKQLDAAMAGVKGLANLLGTSPDEIEKQMTRLAQKGHGVAESLKIIQGANDLKVLGGDVNGLIDAFSALDDKGKVSAKAIAAISGAGLDPKKFRAVLGDAIGSSGDLMADIEKGVASGAINAATLQGAALKTITEMTGKELGGLAVEQTKTLGGMFERLKTLPDRMFDGLDSSKIAEPIKAALGNLMGVFEGPAGKAAVEGLGAAFAKFANVIASIATPANIEALVGVLITLGSWIGQVIDFAIELGGILSDELSGDLGSGAIDALRQTFEHLWKYVSMVPWGEIFRFLVDAILVTVAVLAYMIDGVIGAVEAIVHAFTWMAEANSALWTGMWDGLKAGWDAVVAWFASLPATVAKLGSDIVDGLWNGIKAAWAGMIQSFKGLVDLLPDAVKVVLGIHSPSKVMMGLGKYTAQGFAVGLDQGGTAIPSAFADIVRPPANLGGGAMGGAGQTNTVGDVHVHLNGSQADGSAEQQGRAAGNAARREMIRMFDQFQPA